MRANGWVLQLGPPLVILAALGIGFVLLPDRSVTSALAASVRSCPSASGFYAAVHEAPRKSALPAVVDLRPRLSAAGELVGRTLQITVSGTTARSVNLAAESFVAEPVANVVVYGQSDGARGSAVRAVDLESGCEFSLFTTGDAVRSAVIDAGLGSLYVHSVSSAERADRGVWRVDLVANSLLAAVPPLPVSVDFGPTYATRLRWSLAGDELAVQSCGIDACRTRVLDVAAGTTQSIDQRHGEIVGLTTATLFTFDACDDLPCPLEAVDRRSGRITPLGLDAFDATLELVSGRPLLVADTAAGTKEIQP